MSIRDDRAGFTLIELLIVVAVIGIIAAIAIPGLLRARMSGNETSAIASMRAINAAQQTYAAVAGHDAYATELPILGIPCPGNSQPFLSPDLTAAPVVLKSGYLVTFGAAVGAAAGPNDCNGTATTTTYYATAVPLNTSSGTRSFATGQFGTIFYTNNTTPPTADVVAAGTGTAIE